MAGVQKSLEVISAVTALVVDVADVVKNGVSLGNGSLLKLWDALSELQKISKDASAVLPELKDLDAAEVGQLGSAAYGAFQSIVSTLKQ